MKRFTMRWVSLSIMLLVSLVSWSQLSVFTESFEQSAIPSEWQQSPSTAQTPWSFGTSGVIGINSAYQGSYYASLSTSNSQSSVKLITPLINIGSLTLPEVSFAFVQPSYSGGVHDTLKVWVRTSLAASWQLAATYTDAVEHWQEQHLLLSDFLSMQTNVQIAFEYNFGAGKGIGLDNVIVGNQSVCTQPTNLAAYRLTHESAELMWAASDVAVSYHLKVSTSPLSSMNQTADVFDQVIFFKPFQLNNLLPDTTYYFYVQADCGDNDLSPWSKVQSFTTLCAPVSLPLTEDFENYSFGAGNFPNCWNTVTKFPGDWTANTGSLASYFPYCSNSEAHSGSNALRLQGYYSSASSYTSPRITSSVVALPEVNVTDIAQCQLSFWLYTANTSNNLSVGLMTDPTDESTFEELTLIKATKGNTWEEFILPLTNSDNQGKFVAFRVDGADGTKASQILYIDDVAVELIPACAKPSMAKVTYVSSDYADVTWTCSTTSDFRVLLTTQSIDPATNASAAFIDTLINTNSIHFTGLNPTTTYYCYVQGQCGADGNSVWSNEISFTTGCSAITSFPFIEDFESYTEGVTTGLDNKFMPCWTRMQNQSSSMNYPYVNTNTVYSNGIYSLYFYATGTNFNIAATPEMGVDHVSELKVEFVLGGTSVNAELEVGVMSNPNDEQTFVPVKKIVLPNTTIKTNQTVFFTNYKGNGKYIAFRNNRGASNTVYLDDLKISHIGSCCPPADVTAINITANSADLTWTAMNNAPVYHIKVSTHQLDYPNAVTADVLDTKLSTNQLSLSQLNGSSHYYIYSAIECGSTISEWAVSEFRTKCGSIANLPFTEDFNDISKGAFAQCWTKVFGTTTPSIVTPSTTDVGYQRTASLKFLGNECLFASPAIAADINTVETNFYLAQGSESSGMFIVGVMSDLNDSTTFEPVDTFLFKSYKTFYPVHVSFENVALRGQNRYVAFKQYNNSTTSFFWIDNVTFSTVPTCKEVNNSAITALTDTSVTLSWDAKAGVQGYQVACLEAGQSIENGVITSTTANKLTLNNLVPITDYVLYIRTICSATDTSAWSVNPLQFTTTDAPAILPYSFGFEQSAEVDNWTLSNGSAKNKWCFGNAVKKEGGQALYISDNGGMTHTYTAGAAIDRSYVYASRTLNIPAGQVNFKFNWLANGRTTYDFLAAFLVPAYVDLYQGGIYVDNMEIPFASYYFSNTNIQKDWILLGDKLNGTTNWENFDQTITVENGGCYRLVFCWANYSQSAGSVNPPAAVDNLKVTAITCGMPKLNNVAATDSSATMAWTGFNGASSYQLVIDNKEVADFNNLDAVVYNQQINVDSASINGLKANTMYHAYLRSFCGAADTSEWNAFTFRTNCSALGNYYFEDFEGYGEGSGVTHPCWTTVQAWGNNPYLSKTYNHTDRGNVSYYMCTNSSNTNFNLIASPYINANINNMELSFYTYFTSAGQLLEVGVMSDLSNPNSFVPVQTIVTSVAKAWEKQTVNFTTYTGTGKYIAFRTGGNTKYNYIYIDDVEIMENRACKRPENFGIYRLKETEARVYWASENGSSLYNVKVSSTPINPEVDQADVLDIIDYQDFYVDLTDLTSGTTYFVYVQSNCGDPIGSLWSNEYQFKTVCAPIALPYHQNFDVDPVGSEPECWFSNVQKQGDVPVGSSYAYIPEIYEGVYYGDDKQSLKFYSYYGTSTVSGETTNVWSKTMVVLPKFVADLSALQIKLNYHSATTNAPLMIGAVADPTDASSFEGIDTLLLGGWTQSTVAFDQYQGNNHYLALMIDASLNKASYSAFIDQLEIDSIRKCQTPVNLQTLSIDNHSATIKWESVTSFDSVFNVQVATYDAGFDADEMDLPEYASTILIDTVVVGQQILIQGLQPSTEYFYYVRAVCEDGSHSARFPKSSTFTTACDPKTLPFFDGFEADGFLYDCWQRRRVIDIDNSTKSWVRFSTTTTSGNCYQGKGSLQLEDMKAGNVTDLVLPLINIDSANAYVLKFMMNRTTGSSGKYNEGVKVWINSAPDTVGATQLMYIHRYYTYSPAVAKAGWYEYADTLGVKGNYYIIFQGISEYGTATYIDNISIAHMNSCPVLPSPTVEQVTESTIKFNWESDSTQQVQVAYGLASDPIENLQAIDLEQGQSSYVATGLLPNTTYNLYLRNACQNGIPSAWNYSNAITLQHPATTPFVEDFESNAQQDWSFVGNSVNQFTIGSATAAEGSNSMYITSNGKNSEYSMTALSYAFAYRTVHLEQGSYDLSFNWKAGGEGTYDFGRVFLTPGSFIPKQASNNGISGSTTTPAGWIDCAGKLNGQTTWKAEHQTIHVSTSGDYQLLFYWYNNASSGLQPGLSVDSISLSVQTCYEPFDFKVAPILGNSARISVVSDATTFQLKLDTLALNIDSINGAVTCIDTLTHTASSMVYGLQSSTNYHYWMRSFCASDTTQWQYGGSFTTGCEAIDIDENHSYLENFDSYVAGTGKRPDCWSYESTYTPSSYPYINSSWGMNSSKGFYLYTSGTNPYCYVATPELNVDDVSKLQLVFASKANTTNLYLRVGVMTDPKDITTFEEFTAIKAASEWKQTALSFDNYHGDARFIAFVVDKTYSTATGAYAIDDINISLASDCSVPISISADSIGESEVKLSWNSNNANQQWRVLILPNDVKTVNPVDAIIDTIVTTNPAYIQGISAAMSYNVAIASICGVGDTTSFSSLATFTTNCVAFNLPFEEDFTNVLPLCWNRYSGLASEVFAHKTALSEISVSWIANNLYGLKGNHIKLNIYGISCKTWLVTPVIELAQSSVLTFDMALTHYGNSSAITDPTGQLDDKFMVLVSTDGGVNWNASQATVWNNTGDGDYVYNAIPNTGQKYSVNLNAYTGHDVRIAFYGESTVAVSGEDNDLHLDNIRINQVTTYIENDAICEGYNYSGYGFDISRDDIDVTQSPMRFERVGLNQSGSDSLIVLNLVVKPNAVTHLQATICEGEVYSADGFNATTSGSYRRTMVSASGCDSLIVLDLKVLPRVSTTLAISACQGTLPYNWHNQQISATGTYTDTLQAASGCDSILVLSFTALPDYHLTDVKSISVDELPYHYMDTTFGVSTVLNQPIYYTYHGQTAEGCDSIVSLTLTVNGTVGVNDMFSGIIDIYPNPAALDQLITITAHVSEQELQGLTIDVFNSVGECVKHFMPTVLPVSFSGFDASGVYMVRVTTGSGKVEWSKLIVR